MTNEEWETSQNAAEILLALKSQKPQFFTDQAHQLHYYFLECCKDIAYLTPQKDLKNAIQAGYDWLDGKISDRDLLDYEWHAEAEVFAIQYSDELEDIKYVENLIASILEIRELSYIEARDLLYRVTYFVDFSMYYALGWAGKLPSALSKLEFLNADRLREYIKSPFNEFG